MKKIIGFLILYQLMACSLWETEEAKPLTELDKLPPPTQEGKNTFGCLVNDTAWVTKTSIDAIAVFQQGILQISGRVNSPFQSISVVVIEDNEPIELANYLLTNFAKSYSNASIALTDSTACIYEPINTLTGSITLTRLDRVNFIVSGFFEFTTALNGCDTLKITNGRFDIRYIP